MTGSLRTLPGFMIIGAQKGGTTSLYRLLEKHPGILPAARKEIHFFDNVNHNFRFGINWYRAHFPTQIKQSYTRWIRSQNTLTGEATPYYLFHPLAPERVFHATSKVKLIALLREPVARAYSHYQHNVRKGLERLTFEQAIALEEQRLKRDVERLHVDERYFSYNHMHYSYISRGLYLQQLIRWHRYFPKKQLLVIRSENFFTNPTEAYRQVVEFLEVPPWNLNQYPKYNDGGEYPDINPATKSRLADYFRPHNLELYKYLGIDFGWGF
jgi:hypothetical protein